jgi:hypothetical protein
MYAELPGVVARELGSWGAGELGRVGAESAASITRDRPIDSTLLNLI